MLGTRYRGRRQGVDVRAGSVEQARREAKLTLAQVAGGKLTRTAIHLIEKGRTRPSMETLQLIARQTRKPLDFFLTPESSSVLTERQAQLRELERLTAVRQLEQVIAIGTSLVEQKWSPEDTAVIHFSVGQAYCRLVQPKEAIEHLRPAREQFERSGDEWMAVEALDWESSALGLLDDPDALPLAHQALERCRQLEPKPTHMEARILGHIAGMYVVARSWVTAIRYYEAAAAAASVVKDLLLLAKMHHGLGLAYKSIHQPAPARQHYDKALTLYSIESDFTPVYRVENDLGDLLLQQGRLDAAEQHFLKALAGSNELNMDRRGHGFILANLGEVRLRRGELSEAEAYLQQALEVAEAITERGVCANARGLLGRLAERQRNAAMADRHFETANGILEQLGMPERPRDAHLDYAPALDARNDGPSATLHCKPPPQHRKLANLGVSWSGSGDAERESLHPTGSA